MRETLLRVATLAMIAGSALFGQNLVGSWQGSLAGPEGRPPLRLVIKISREADEKLKAVLYSIDQGGQGLTASAITQQGASLKVSVAAIGGEYQGKLNPEGDGLAGTWTQGGPAQALNLVKPTPETAWTIPEPPPPLKAMPLDAKPVFDVATIKPSRPDARGTNIQVGRGGTNLFTTMNTSLKELIVFAYGLHSRQVSGGLAWVENDHFDITGKPDLAGSPSVLQLQSMVQKLLVDRFQLTFHKESKELSVYALTVMKTGVKMAKTESGAGNLPGYGGQGQGRLAVRNSNMADFAGFLQSRIVDRPVVDRTALPDRYDFTLKWTPDVNQPPAPGQPPAVAGLDVDAPPDLFAAFQQQLGLKLEATKAPVEVMVIDKVEKPSEN
jgi:uncharacterized protein (TIGR03435 family)